MLALIRREPALVTGLVLALIGVAAAFGLSISADQKAAIVSLIGSVLAIVGAVHVRGQVSPVAKPAKRRSNMAGHSSLDVVIQVLAIAFLVVIVVAALKFLF